MGREDLSQVREGLGGPPARPGGVRKTSRISGRGQKDLSQVREGSGGPLAGPGGVGKTSRSAKMSQEDFPQVSDNLPQVWEDPRRISRGREEFPQVREGSG